MNLRLRPLRMTDVRPLIGICNTMDVARYIALMPHPFSHADAKRFVRFGQDNLGFVFGIEVDGALIGALQMRDEFEYFLDQERWGRGYATDAGQMALDHLFSQTRRNQITSGYFQQNAASGRVLEKLGFIKTTQQVIVTRHLPMALHQGMVLTRERWAALRA